MMAKSCHVISGDLWHNMCRSTHPMRYWKTSSEMHWLRICLHVSMQNIITDGHSLHTGNTLDSSQVYHLSKQMTHFLDNVYPLQWVSWPWDAWTASPLLAPQDPSVLYASHPPHQWTLDWCPCQWPLNQHWLTEWFKVIHRILMQINARCICSSQPVFGAR